MKVGLDTGIARTAGKTIIAVTTNESRATIKVMTVRGMNTGALNQPVRVDLLALLIKARLPNMIVRATNTAALNQPDGVEKPPRITKAHRLSTIARGMNTAASNLPDEVDILDRLIVRAMNTVVLNQGAVTGTIKTVNHSVANMLVKGQRDINVQMNGFKKM
jgi:hypothetical protein